MLARQICLMATRQICLAGLYFQNTLAGRSIIMNYINELHNSFRLDKDNFNTLDPHLKALAQLKYQYSPDWWTELNLHTPGIYILTGGRQIGKSTSCKLLIQHCLSQNILPANQIAYLSCDEIFDAKTFGQTLRAIINSFKGQLFLMIIDEVTYVKEWDRVIKALADEGAFSNGACVLTGSDTLILKEAAMRFPGRRGNAKQVDFHLYPLAFADYVNLIAPNDKHNSAQLALRLNDYLQCGGYLRAINDLAMHGSISESTYMTYEQWIRGDFLSRNKNEEYLLLVLRALLTVGVSQVSFSALTQKIGLISKETCIDYCRLLERMDILFNLQAYDQNKKQGFPRKNRKFHLFDPFIFHTISRWLQRDGLMNYGESEPTIVEACVASHCYRKDKTYYFKGQGEVDVIWLHDNRTQAIAVKWASQLRPNDLKMLSNFKDRVILTKHTTKGKFDHTDSISVADFLYNLR